MWPLAHRIYEIFIFEILFIPSFLTEKKSYSILMFLIHTTPFHVQLDLFPLFFFLASHFSIFDLLK